MLRSVWHWLREVLSGHRLAQAIKRNERAAEELDHALRKVLRR